MDTLDDQSFQEPDEPMRLGGPKEIEDEMDITPMIDITFLLLIFFLVASKLSKTEQIAIPEAKQGAAVLEKDCVIIMMKRGTGEVAAVTKPGGNPFSTDPEQQESEIAEYVSQGLSGGKQGVMIKSEGSVRYGEVDRIRKAISQSMEEGQLIHVGVKQER